MPHISKRGMAFRQSVVEVKGPQSSGFCSGKSFVRRHAAVVCQQTVSISYPRIGRSIQVEGGFMDIVEIKTPQSPFWALLRGGASYKYRDKYLIPDQELQGAIAQTTKYILQAQKKLDRAEYAKDRCPEIAPTFSPFLARLWLRPAAPGPLVEPQASPASQDRSIDLARLCPLPTRSAAQARAFHCQSSARRAGLSLSFPLRMRDSWRQSPFSSQLYDRITSRLWKDLIGWSPRTDAVLQ
jgi:hypothetical protein